MPVSCSVPAVSVDGVVRPFPLGSDAEQRLLSVLKSYQATAVQRLLNRLGAPSLAVRMTFACEACEVLPCRVKVGLQVVEVTLYAARVRRCAHAKNSATQPTTANRLHKPAHGAGGGVTGERGVVFLPPAQTAGTHLALPGWGAPSTALAF